jgi:2-polyprenyl-6-methoxyphenol hydroxylase-like FAD-dependent oxidoreductase
LIWLLTFFFSFFKKSFVTCDHAVVGGGPVGTFFAWQMKKNFPSRSVCLFEATAEVGGRFNDTLFQGARIPNGGMRWREYGNNTMAIYTRLADELGITRDADITTDFLGSNLWRARGVLARSTQDLVSQYTNDLAFRSAIPGCGTQCQIYRALINKTNTDPQVTRLLGMLSNCFQPGFSAVCLQFWIVLEFYPKVSW